MERATRLWVILGVVLCVGLGLSLRWAMLPEDADSGEKSANPVVPSVIAPSPPPPEPAPEAIAPAAPQPATDSGGVVRGRIFDAATRTPVTEFEVRLRVPLAKQTGKEQPVSRTFRSELGQFAWKAAPPGTWRVTVLAEGYQRFELNELRVAEGKMSPEIVAPMLRGHRLTGRVFDEASRKPIRGARIFYRETHLSLMEGSQLRDFEATSGEDGSFALEGVPAGRITVTAHARDYAYREREVVVDEKTPRVEIALGRGGLIAGQLAEADGTAIAGSISLHNLDGHANFVSKTEASGQFSFDHLQPGRYQLVGHAGGSATSRLEVTLAENERMDSLVLTLRKGRSVRGVVRGLQPEQFDKAFVGLRTKTKGAYFSSQLDHKGAFAMQGVPAGSAELTLHVWDQKETWNYQSAVSVDVPADTDLAVNFDMPSGARLSGRVTQGGIPKVGNQVWARPVNPERRARYSAQVAENGVYEIGGLPSGEYELQTDETIPRRVRISGDTVFDIELPSSQLAGRIVEEGASVPIVGSGVHIINAKSEAPSVRVYKETDHSGQFSMVGLQPGDLLLSVYKPGYEMFRERVTYDTPISDMTIRLRRSPGVAISVVDAESGRGVREVFLNETIGETRGIGLWVRLDENGAGSLPSALAGSTLRISAQGAYAPEVIREWNAQPLELRLKRREND